MSMKFNPYYGLSIKDTADEIRMDGKLVLKSLKKILYQQEEAQEVFFEMFLTEDEFEDNTDFIYGIETYDIKEDMKKFDKENSGDSSFVSCLTKFIENVDFNIGDCKKYQKLIMEYVDKLPSKKLTPKVYSVYI